MDLVIKHNATLTNINTRIEHHGDERVPAADIDLMLNDIEAGELDQFALDGNMISTTLWEKDKDKDLAGGYKLGSPILGLVKGPHAIDVKVDSHKVVINIESAEEQVKKVLDPIIINPAVIKKIKFTPKHHGLADVTLQIAGNLEGKDTGKIIDKYLGERISLTIDPAENTQQGLLDDDATQQGASGSAQPAEEATAA